jgi:putative alpha-1,2-mannosidase
LVLVFIRFPLFKIKIETQHLGEWISPIFQAENQGRTKDFGVTGAAPKFIIVFLFGYISRGDSFTLSLS